MSLLVRSSLDTINFTPYTHPVNDAEFSFKCWVQITIMGLDVGLLPYGGGLIDFDDVSVVVADGFWSGCSTCTCTTIHHMVLS